MALEPWRTATVIKTIDETYNTRRFLIQVDELPSFNFKPGQFVTLDLPIHPQRNKRWRSYSIASAPDGTNIYELIIVLLKEGAGSNYVFNETKVGSQLTFRGPQGAFTLPQTIDKDLFLICTGTGIAPFRSMLQYLKSHSVPHKKIYLIFGCRTRADLLYYDEMKALENELEDFTYIVTLSRETWEGHHGYVHHLYEEICNKNNEGCEKPEDLKPADFYLCGWKFMIDDARKKILEMGYDKRNIHYELYG